MKKWKSFSLETIIAISWREAYYGTRRGDYHRGCCDHIPIGEGNLCFASQYELLTKRCQRCQLELTTKTERTTLTAASF